MLALLQSSSESVMMAFDSLLLPISSSSFFFSFLQKFKKNKITFSFVQLLLPLRFPHLLAFWTSQFSFFHFLLAFSQLIPFFGPQVLLPIFPFQVFLVPKNQSKSPSPVFPSILVLLRVFWP
jgi:hypothetical protein